jgi:hypothetical protein
MGDLGQMCVQIPAGKPPDRSGVSDRRPRDWQTVPGYGWCRRQSRNRLPEPGDGKAGKSGAEDHQSHRFTCFLTRSAG